MSPWTKIALAGKDNSNQSQETAKNKNLEGDSMRAILFHKWAGFACVLSIPLISIGSSRDPFPSKPVSDPDERQSEDKGIKHSSKLFRCSKADKGNCKAGKEMFFFLWLLLYPDPVDALLLNAAGLPLNSLQRL